MKYLNVQIFGLSGAPHPVRLNINTSQDALKLRHHLKFLCGDYLTSERLSLDQGLSPHCKLCLAPVETIEHVLTLCRGTRAIVERLLSELLNTVLEVQPNCAILNNPTQPYLTQFILDCTSLNLPDSYRVPAHNPNVTRIMEISCDWCHAISKERARQLKQLG